MLGHERAEVLRGQTDLSTRRNGGAVGQLTLSPVVVLSTYAFDLDHFSWATYVTLLSTCARRKSVLLIATEIFRL